ncbi:MAG: RNA recognition motif domain-containing protein [Prolixibacteraceae bacterium]
MDIFVAKLNSDTTADQITELFSQFGNVTSCKLIMDRETGMSKCYAFVEMDDAAEGDSAIEHLNESNFMGNYIVVKKSEPRPQEKRSFDRRPGGGGGGGARRPDGNHRNEGNRPFNRNSGSRDSGGSGDRRNSNRDRDRNFNKYD